MRAIIIDRFGGPEVLTLRDIESPRAGPGQVRVRIKAAGVNPIDAIIRSGAFGTIELPYVVGVDLAGEVIEVGDGVDRLVPGMTVYAHMRGGNGTYAEEAVLPAEWVARKPDSLSFEEAAAVPCAALTAYQALTETLEVRAGETLLVTGAAGGVGHFAVQFAVALGLKVVGTAGHANQTFVRGLGATPLDYRREDFVLAARGLEPAGFDHVFSTVGGDTKMRAGGAARDGGRLLWISSEEPEGPVMERDVCGHLFYARADHRTLARIGALIDAGRVRVHLDRTMPLGEAAEAHRLVEAGHVRGKISLRVAS